MEKRAEQKIKLFKKKYMENGQIFMKRIYTMLMKDTMKTIASGYLLDKILGLNEIKPRKGFFNKLFSKDRKRRRSR